MYSELPQYYKPSDFAQIYIKRDGSKGVNKAFIYQLINKEMKKANSTDIDILVVGGVKFVKYRNEPKV